MTGNISAFYMNEHAKEHSKEQHKEKNKEETHKEEVNSVTKI